ncbi:radical SAM protein [Curtobacterium citreum]|uniref:radical SAM protein n=1 Tax=Curtobacterium citreum TaxID=2036 RepID=UPI002542D28D|nr:radical SAM protein [Curtobacterium citreum]WIJ46549.1 radical SAM protein [Curtobacterium citreum]
MADPRWSVGINFDSKCNARCAHCCVSSSPDATANLDDDLVDKILEELLQEPNVREIGLTGGEPLIRRARTMSIIGKITASGRIASCVTNGFWGVTPRAADRVLRDFEHAGLRELTLSYDDFHSPYIGSERIRNILNASHDRKIKVVLNMCVSRSRDSRALLAELGESVHGIQVTQFPVVPAGEARSLPDHDFHRRPITEGMLHCPGNQVIYHNDGNIYPCCSPPIFDTAMTLGRADGRTFRQAVESFERNALLGIVQREGFGWFIDAIRRVAPEAPAACVTEVVSACELCSIIFRDEASVASIRPQVDAYWAAVRAG